MTELSSSHDTIFRRILGIPENAASQLRSVLPPALVSRLDLTRLTPVPGSFVDDELLPRYSDLVFSAPLQDGTKAFVYILIEHQSTTEPMMAFRMLHYIVRLWDRYLRENRNASALPPVIPLVVHHNRQRWNAPTTITELINADDELINSLGTYLPQFQFLLDDLTVLDDNDLRTRPLTPPARITLISAKTASTTPELMAKVLHNWEDDLRQIAQDPSGLAYLITFLTYIYRVGKVPRDEVQELIDHIGPKAKEAHMTTAEMLRNEFREDFRAEVDAKVREARTEARVEMFLEQLAAKFGPLPDLLRDSVRAASADELTVWATRILTAETLHDVFA